jgi:hypothetical protein
VLFGQFFDLVDMVTTRLTVQQHLIHSGAFLKGLNDRVPAGNYIFLFNEHLIELA